jgi:hypothetical protein
VTSGDDTEPRIDTRAGLDTDQDGFADTLALPDLAEPALAVDLDHDGFADVILRIDADGAVQHDPLGPSGLEFLGDPHEPPLLLDDPSHDPSHDPSDDQRYDPGYDPSDDPLFGPWLG